MRNKIIQVRVLECAEVENTKHNQLHSYRIRIEYMDDSYMFKTDVKDYHEEEEITQFNCQTPLELPLLNNQEVFLLINEKLEVIAGYVPKTKKGWGSEEDISDLKKERKTHTAIKKKSDKEHYIYFTGKILKKEAITTIWDYNKDDIYKEIKHQGFKFEVDGFKHILYTNNKWDKLKPGDKIKGIASWSNKNIRGEKIWLLFAENTETGERLGRRSLNLPLGIVFFSLLLVAANIYGLYYDTYNRHIPWQFLFKWGLINFGGALFLSLAVLSFIRDSVYARFYKKHFSNGYTKSNGSTENSIIYILKKPFVLIPLFFSICFSLFCYLFFHHSPNLQADCSQGNPETVQYLKNNRLLVTSLNQYSKSYLDQHDFRQYTYQFDGFSFNLLDATTGQSLKATCWFRKRVENLTESKSLAMYNNPEYYSTFVTDSNEIFILFHPDNSIFKGDEKVPSYVSRLKIQGDSMLELPDIDLQNFSFDITKSSGLVGKEDGYALLKNEFNEKHFLHFSSGEIEKTLHASKVHKQRKDRPTKDNAYEQLFFFCPTETGSSRTQLYFLKYMPSSKNAMFSYLPGYKAPRAGARFKQKYFSDFSERPKYYPSTITNYSRPGVEAEINTIKNPEQLLKINDKNGAEPFYVEPSVLFQSDSTALFSSKENSWYSLHFANSRTRVWTIPVPETKNTNQKEITAEDFTLVKQSANTYWVLLKNHWLACINGETGTVVWSYSGK